MDIPFFPMLILVVVAGIVFLKFLTYVMVWFRLTGARVQQPGSTVIDRAEISATEVLDHARETLKTLGFGYRHSERIVPIEALPGRVLEADVYFHPPTRSYAIVTPALLPEPGRLWNVEFTTCYSDGTFLTTVNSEASTIPWVPAWYRIQDAYAETPTQQWEVYCGRLATEAPSVAAYDYDVEQENPFYRELLALWLAKGKLKPAPEGGCYQLRAWPALQYSHVLITAMRKRRGVPVAKTPAAPLEIEVAAHVFAFEWQQAADEQRRHSLKLKRWLFAGSALAFVAAFGVLFAWDFALLLLAVLLVHEAGHWLAMRAFGYRNTQIVFLPLLGAVATGHRIGTPPWQQFIIYLAGPLPGLVVGLGLLSVSVYSDNDQWFNLGLIAVILNYFNLLPIVPLDGGRIVETLFFRSLPWLRFAFVTTGTVLLAWGAYAWQDGVLMVLTALMVLGLLWQWRHARAGARLLRSMPAATPSEQYVQRVFRLLLKAPFRHYRFNDRYTVAKSLMDWLAIPRPSVGFVVLGSLIYLGALVLPVYYAAQQMPEFSPIVAMLFSTEQAAEAPDWELRLAETEAPAERWEVLQEAAGWHLDQAEYEQATTYYQRARQLALEAFPPEDGRQFESLRVLAEIQGYSDENENYDNPHKIEALAWLDRHGEPYDLRRAELWESLLWGQPLDDAARLQQRIEEQEQALVIRRYHQQSQQAVFAGSLHNLANLHQEAGRLEAAAQALQQAMHIYARYLPEEILRWETVVRGLASLYLTQEHTEEAVILLQQCLQQVQTLEYAWSLRPEFLELLGWSHILRDEWQAAEAVFAQRLTLVREIYPENFGGPLFKPLLDAAYVAWQQDKIAEFHALRRELDRSAEYNDIHALRRELAPLVEEGNYDMNCQYWAHIDNALELQPTDDWRVWQWDAHRVVLAQQ